MSRDAGYFLLRSPCPRRGSRGPGRHREKPGSRSGARRYRAKPRSWRQGIDGAKNGLIDLNKGAGFREFVLRSHPKRAPYDEPVRVGAILPESGVEYHEAPPQYGDTPYRYTVIGGDPVLVDPNTRVIKQVIK